jgi:hypothetical protein
VLEDLGRREVPVHLATANAFRSPLPLFILLDLVEELPLVAWVVGARHGAFFGPIPVRALFFCTEVLPSVGQCTGKHPSHCEVPPSGVPGTWSS